MSLVMLRPDRVGPLRRTVRDKTGAVRETLVFERRKPVELSRLQLSAVERDLARGGLVPVRLNAKGNPVAIAADDEPPATKPAAKPTAETGPPAETSGAATPGAETRRSRVE